MITPGEIQQIAGRLGLRATQIEKDYIIGWILKGISSNGYLKKRLLFKGGTALRKIYFMAIVYPKTLILPTQARIIAQKKLKSILKN